MFSGILIDKLTAIGFIKYADYFKKESGGEVKFQPLIDRMKKDMKAKKSINVVYITDESYAMPTCISIFSAIKNAGRDDSLDFYVLCNGMTDESKMKFESLNSGNVNVNLIDVKNEKYVEMAKSCLAFPHIHVSSVALFKFNLPEILMDLEKVIYIDGDTLIQKSLRGLYNWDIQGAYVAAVDDVIDKIRGGMFSNQIGISSHYFNSGVMLLNLEKMRKENITEKLIEYRMNERNFFMDQDALNVVLGKKRNILPYIYNFMATITDNLDIEEIQSEFQLDCSMLLEGVIDSAVIVHMTDQKKPWVYNLPWYSERFMKYYKDSPYSNVKIELKSPLKVLCDMNFELKRQKKILENRLQNNSKSYWNIIKNHKVALYGAGRRGKRICDKIQEENWCDVIIWVDKNYKKIGEGIDSPQSLKKTDFDYVLITIVDDIVALETKLDLAKKYHIEIGKILTIHML